MTAAELGWYVAGFMLEIVGLTVAGFGLVTTWRAFKRPEQRFPAVVLAKRIVAKLVPQPLQRRRLRHPQRQMGEDVAHITESARVRRTWVPLPDLSANPEAFMSELEKRLSSLISVVEAVEGRLNAEAATWEAAVSALRSDLDAQIENVEQMSRSIAVDGITIQALGWGLIVVGVICQGIAAILQA